jgi:hypothetical protein
MKEIPEQNKRLLEIMKERGFLLSYRIDPIRGALELDLSPDGNELARLIQKLCPSAKGFTNSDVVNLVTFFMNANHRDSRREPFLLN